MATQDDTTMNQFFVVAIAVKISTMKTTDFFGKRAALAGTTTGADAAWSVGADAFFARGAENW